MAFNEYMMYQRKHKKEVSSFYFLKYEAIENQDYYNKEQLGQKSKALQYSVSKLAPGCQKILRLRMSGARYREIARELNISVKTVESQMRIVYQKLRVELKNLFLLFWSKIRY